jgi:hypothetical protein
MSASLLLQNPKKLAQTRRSGRRRGTSLKALRTNNTAVRVVVKLAITGGIQRTALLYGGLIESAFLMYFYYYIFEYHTPFKTMIL